MFTATGEMSASVRSRAKVTVKTLPYNIVLIVKAFKLKIRKLIVPF